MRVKHISMLTTVAIFMSNCAGGQLFMPGNQWLWSPLVNISVPYILSVVLLMCLASTILFATYREDKLSLVLVSILFAVYIVFVDFNLFQPYNWLYFLVLLVLNESESNKQNLKHVVLLMLAGVYIWSGLHKINPHYAQFAFKNMFSGLFELPTYWGTSSWHYVAYVSAVLEIVLGIALMIPKLRFFGTVGLILMHLLIFLSIGPTGLSWNPTVWPWNVYMVCLLIWSTSGLDRSNWWMELEKLVFNDKKNLCILIAVWVFPIASSFGLLPFSTGWHLYSAKESHMYLCLTNFPQPEIAADCLVDDGSARFYTDLYYIRHTKTAIVPEQWILEEVSVRIQKKHPELQHYSLNIGIYYDDWQCEQKMRLNDRQF